VRRGNRYFVKDDIDTGVADYEFVYGDARDTVLVGNWDGHFDPGAPDDRNTTDTLMVRRGNRFFVSNANSTGVADYDFTFGDPNDVVLVGDWTQNWWSGEYFPTDSEGADQIAIRRGNEYIESQEVWYAVSYGNVSGSALWPNRSYFYGNPTDTAFTAKLEWLDVPRGGFVTYHGDGLAVRR
jgi:hypothetical protein